MNMKKSLTALAVAAGLGAPFVAVADADVYGSVRIAALSVNDDAVAQTGVDEGVGLFSPASRLGFRGEEDIGGLTAFAHYELGINATSMSIAGSDRLSYVGLRGAFGEVQGGRVWSAWYDYIGWTTDRSWFWGGTGYYGYTHSAVGALGIQGVNVGPTTRSSNTLKYTYGAGGYGTDPFTFSVEAQMDGSANNGVADGTTIGTTTGGSAIESDSQLFDILTVAGQGTFGDFTVGLAHRVTNNATDPSGSEPSQTAVSFRWDPSAPFYIGAIYSQADRDISGSGDSPSFFEVLGTMDFGGGLSGQLGLSTSDMDLAGTNGAGDTDGVFLQLNQALSSRTNVFGELQSLSIDGGNVGDDEDPMLLMVGMEHSF